MNDNQFETKWTSLITRYLKDYGSFEYIDISKSIEKVITSCFDQVQRVQKYGIYVIRQKNDHKVLYIGKGGTIKQDGKFKKQDIPKRLKNTRGKISCEKWFSTLFNEKGPLIIEYIFLETKPESPALVEALLVQEYLNEYGCLPCKNSGF